MTPAPISETISLGDHEFCVHTWNKKDAPSQPDNAVVIIYHGFGAHGLYPTVRYAAELLASCQNQTFTVVAADMRGHGQSPGLKGYLPSAQVLLQDAQQVAEYVQTQYRPKKLFLLGSSMGGTMALQVARQLPKEVVAGVLLLAPMLKLSVSGVEQTLLSGLAFVAPTWQIIPSSSTNAEKQYRDEAKRRECETDPYTAKASTIRVGSASSCVELAKSVQFDQVQVPFWLGVADQDVVVDPQGSLDLYEQAPATDKTLKRYAALHGLLCEPSPLFDEISKDILDWIGERC